MAKPPSTSEPAPVRAVINPAAVIVVCATALTFLGLIILFSASAAYKQGPYFYLKKQIIGVLLAGALAYVTSRIDLENLRRYAWYIGVGSALALLAVLVPHVGV